MKEGKLRLRNKYTGKSKKKFFHKAYSTDSPVELLMWVLYPLSYAGENNSIFSVKNLILSLMTSFFYRFSVFKI